MKQEDLFKTNQIARLVDWPEDYRQKFWDEYPRKVSKSPALKKLDTICQGGKVPWRTLIEGLRRYKAWLADSGPRRWRPSPKHPTTWLNHNGWEDEYEDNQQHPATFSDIALGRF